MQHDQQTIANYPVGGVASTPTNRYVYASYIDEPVVRKAAGAGGTVHYYHRAKRYGVIVGQGTGNEPGPVKTPGVPFEMNYDGYGSGPTREIDCNVTK